jgi:hypothetical protein
MKTKELLQRAILHYGDKAQILMLIEELEELYEALTIHQEEYKVVVEEIADVAICLNQAYIIFNLEEHVYPVNSKVSTFNTIKHQVTIFICRTSRGRDVSPSPLFELSGWIIARMQDTDAKKDVQNIIKKKLIRLHGRLRDEKAST